MKQIGSEITTLRREPGSRTGTPDGGRGSAGHGSSALAVQWLADRQPDQVDAAAVSRVRSLGVGLRVAPEMQGRYGKGGDWLGYVATGRTICTVDAKVGGIAGIEAAIAEIEKFTLPAPETLLEDWLGRLALRTVKREEESWIEDARLTEYVGLLSGFPADAVREALLGRAWHFFPSWGELRAVLDEVLAPRLAMKAALERALEVERRRAAEPEEVIPSVEDVARAREARRAAKLRTVAELAEQFTILRRAVKDEEPAPAGADGPFPPVGSVSAGGVDGDESSISAGGVSKPGGGV